MLPFRVFNRPAALRLPRIPNCAHRAVLTKPVQCRIRSSRSLATSTSQGQQDSGSAFKSMLWLFDIQALYNLAISSGILLIGSAIIFPEAFGRGIASFRDRLEASRQQKMIETFLLPDDDQRSSKAKLEDAQFHGKLVDDLQKNLLTAPLEGYGIVSGTRGSGKSYSLRRILETQPHVVFISFDFIPSIKYLIDRIASRVGYDFDEWTERILQSYLFNTKPSSEVPPRDKLAFLLTEIESACRRWKNDERNKNNDRMIIVFDDIHKMDYTDAQSREATEMLFKAATKWAQDDIALIIFTMSDYLYHHNLKNIVGRELLEYAQHFHVGNFNEKEATFYLNTTMQKNLNEQELQYVFQKVGTRFGELQRLCKDAHDKQLDIKSLVDQSVEAAEIEWRQFFSDADFKSQKEKLGTLLFLDSILTTRNHFVGNREFLRGKQLLPVFEKMLQEEMLSYRNEVDVDFVSHRYREGYRLFRRKSSTFGQLGRHEKSRRHRRNMTLPDLTDMDDPLARAVDISFSDDAHHATIISPYISFLDQYVTEASMVPSEYSRSNSSGSTNNQIDEKGGLQVGPPLIDSAVDVFTLPSAVNNFIENQLGSASGEQMDESSLLLQALNPVNPSRLRSRSAPDLCQITSFTMSHHQIQHREEEDEVQEVPVNEVRDPVVDAVMRYLERSSSKEEGILILEALASVSSFSLVRRESLPYRCPSLFGPDARFVPTRWLANAHLQTAFVQLLKPAPPFVKYEREIITLRDGATLALDWCPGVPKDPSDPTPLLFLVHGLNGASSESYVRSLVHLCRTKRHYRCVVMNYRGCGNVPLTTPKIFNISDPDQQDIEDSLTYIRNSRAHRAKMIGVGWSMGSSLLLNYLSSAKENTLLSGAATLGCVFDLNKCIDNFATSLDGGIYNSALTLGLQLYAYQ
ncbi:hypothetical protein HDU76_012427 [Blyttiomyces sp. JEL0837]|nr:hypothetical protein HDU76_012427 [Blyttiomyces sp. JEL0837]